jgi:hypothetical protein
MTPDGWLTEDFAGWGALWLFLGALPAAGLAALVSRWKGVTTGAGSGLLVWGLGNLVVALGVALATQVDSVDLTLPLMRCDAGQDHRQRAERTLTYRLVQPGRAEREVALPTTRGRCPDEPMGQTLVRVRKDTLASTAPRIKGEDAGAGNALVIMLLWGVFGSFAVLGGGLMVRSERPHRPAPPAASAQAPAAWRTGIGTLLGQLGLVLFLAAFVVPWFLDGSTERALQFGMRCVASAMACWLVAGLVAGSMNLGAGVFLLAFGGAMLGFAELIRLGG